jgi:hypothetical protein
MEDLRGVPTIANGTMVIREGQPTSELAVVAFKIKVALIFSDQYIAQTRHSGGSVFPWRR